MHIGLLESSNVNVGCVRQSGEGGQGEGIGDVDGFTDVVRCSDTLHKNVLREGQRLGPGRPKEWRKTRRRARIRGE